VWGCPVPVCLWQGLCNGRMSVRPFVCLSRTDSSYRSILICQSAAASERVASVLWSEEDRCRLLTLHTCVPTYLRMRRPVCIRA